MRQCGQTRRVLCFGAVNRRFECPLLAAATICRCSSRSEARSWPQNRRNLANVGLNRSEKQWIMPPREWSMAIKGELSVD
jgi:hypothetical protein